MAGTFAYSDDGAYRIPFAFDFFHYFAARYHGTDQALIWMRNVFILFSHGV